MTKCHALIASFALALLAPLSPAQAGPPRVQNYEVRDATIEDVQSLTLVRHPDGGIIETWVLIAYTTEDEPLGPVVYQAHATGPPRLNQLEAILTAGLNQLQDRLDEAFPPGGPPQPIADPGSSGGGGGRGGGKP